MSRNLVKNPPVLTRQQRKLREAFQEAESVEEMLNLLNIMEACFPESEMAMECLAISHKFHRKGGPHEQVLGKRALSILIRNNDNDILCTERSWKMLIDTRSAGITECTQNRSPSFYIALLCNLLGEASDQLKRYEESLSYLNWADRNLTKLLELDSNSLCTANCVLNTLIPTHSTLMVVKIDMSKKEEIVFHAKKILEIREKTVEEGSIDMGHANKFVAYPYFLLGKYRASLPFYLKALDIFTKHVGDGSIKKEIADIRKNLGTIYVELGDNDKALEQARLSSLNGGLDSEMEVANMLLELGRNEEGIEAFKSLLPRAETEGNRQVRAHLFTCMAKGFCDLGKFSDAKNYMEKAATILEKKKMSPAVVATAFDDMSRIYEKMGDYESAFSILKRAMAIPQLPRKNLSNTFGRLFLLISTTGNYEQGIPYLEEALEILKKKFGQHDDKVASGYGVLGLFYKHLGKLDIAAECFVRSKELHEVSLGPYHLESLKASQTLSMTYAEMERFDLAIEIQEKAVRGFEVLGPTAQNGLNGALCLLKELKDLATCRDSDIFPMMNSKGDVSEDGNVGFSIPETEGNQEARAVSLMCKARDFCKDAKIISAKKCVDIAQKIFDKNDISPLVRATAYEDMLKVYEVLVDYGAAISYLGRALVIPELPQDHHMDSCSRLFSLISLIGEEKQGISYLKEAVERLIEKFGPNHVQVGFGYTNLGTAYMNSDETESAVKVLAYAKNILDVSLGPHHFDSLETSQRLSINCAIMGRFAEAMEIQEKVIEGLKSLGQSEKEFQEEAVELFNQMKEMSIDEVAESPEEHA